MVLPGPLGDDSVNHGIGAVVIELETECDLAGACFLDAHGHRRYHTIQSLLVF